MDQEFKTFHLHGKQQKVLIRVANALLCAYQEKHMDEYDEDEVREQQAVCRQLGNLLKKIGHLDVSEDLLSYSSEAKDYIEDLNGEWKGPLRQEEVDGKVVLVPDKSKF